MRFLLLLYNTSKWSFLMTIKINLNSVPSEIFTIELEQVAYRMKVNWVDKEDAWYLSLYDRFGQAIFLGHKLLYNSDISTKYKAHENMPQGLFALVDSTGGLDRPTYESLSTTDAFYYFLSSELE